MNEEFDTGRSKSKYLAAGIATVFFLLILPGIVLAMASNMTNVELRITRDRRPIPEYELLDRRILTSGAYVKLRVPEKTSDKELRRILRHVIADRLPLQKRTGVTCYIYRQSSVKTNLRRGPSKSEADQTYYWTLTHGLELVENGDPSLPKPFSLGI